MRNRILVLCLTLMAAMPGLAFAQYDFDTLMTNLPARLNVATVNNWSAGSQIWQFVVPNGSGTWRQLSATFPLQDHTNDGIDDDDQLALLAKILNNDACTRALLGDAKMDAIQAAFATNYARVQQFELTICLQILDSTRITARIDSGTFLGCISLSNRPAWMDNTNITTGAPASLCMTVDTGTIIGDYGDCFDADIPSLWGPDGILDSVEDGFSDDFANLLAAWLTIGDQSNVDYVQCLIAQVFAKGVLPNIATIILDAIGGKNYDVPPQNDINIDVTFPSPGYQIQIGDGCGGPDFEYIRILRFVGRILGTCVHNGLEGWLHNYRVNDNGFVSFPAWLPAAGNLNEIGFTNVLSYTQNGNDRTKFMLSEWAGYPALSFSPQPAGPGTPLVYGGTNWNFTPGLVQTPSGILDVIQPTNYQWQWLNGAVWQNIPGATSLFYSLPLDYLGTRSYRLTLAAPAAACGSVTSNTASVEVVPPPINITQQPTGGTVAYGDDLTLTVAANIAVGTLSYQWQLDSSNIPGATNPSYDIIGADFDDDGFYRCVITANSFPGHQQISDQVLVEVEAPPINITLQPVGAVIPEGGSHLLETAANIAIGGLTYQWQQNGSNIPGATAALYNITSADGTDQGNYRCRISSVAIPGHFAFTDTVFVKVGTGTVFYVDQLSPAAVGTEDGLSWDTAFKTIQQGIDAAWASGGGEVWVAGGPEGGPDSPYIYNELRSEPWGKDDGGGPGGTVTGSLVLKDGVELYGGFEGYWGMQEATRSQRGVRRAVTIIDGSVSRGGLPAYHVVVAGKEIEASGGVRIDGFDIRGGNAAGIVGSYHTYRGGGIYNWQSPITIANCTIYGNTAAVSGGGLSNETGPDGAANATIQNCVFWDNLAIRGQDDPTTPNPIRGGGAMFNNDADVAINFCTLFDNAIGTPGYTDWGATSAGIYQWQAAPTVENTVFAAHGPGLSVQDDNPGAGAEVAVLTFCSIDPAPSPFLTTGPEFYLAPGAVLIDQALGTALTRDLPGAPRPQPVAGVPDIGAYEFLAGTPSAVCQDTSATLDGNLATVPASAIFDPSSAAPGGIYKILINGDPTWDYTCAEIGDNAAALTVIDFHGNTDSCINATVTIDDEELPVAACQNITVQLDGTGNVSIDPQDVDGGSTDNCSIDWLASTVVPNAFTCANIGTPVTVTLTVQDTAGNTDTCLASITVEDQLAPVMACKNISIDLDEFGDASITTADIDNGTADNCDPAPALSLDITSFTCANLGDNTVTLTGEDTYGNSDSCTATVTVNDVTPAVITLNGDALVQIPINDPYTELGAVADDACDGSQPAVVGGNVVDTSTLGFYDVDYDYTDGSGNVSTTVTRTVRVVSRPEITILGANPVTLECRDVYSDDGATASDTIDGDLTASIVTTGLPIDTNFTGVYQLVYTVTNSFGVTTQAIRVVEVVDTVAPTLSVVGPTTFYVVKGGVWNQPEAVADDACDGFAINFGIVFGGDYPVDTNTVGDYNVTVDVSDNYGNPAPTVNLTVHVIESLLHFPVQPQDDEAYVDDPAFELSAVFDGGYNATAYEWSRVQGVITTPLGSEPVTGNTVTVSVDPAALGVGVYGYYVRVTDEIGTTQSATGDVTIANHMSIASDLQDAEVVIGSKFDLSIDVDGGLGTPTYQWFKDDGAKVMQLIGNGGNISGAGTDTLTFDPFNLVDEGDYQVFISDNYETIESSIATLTAVLGVPVAGAIGLAVLTAFTALGGATALRRRNRK